MSMADLFAAGKLSGAIKTNLKGLLTKMDELMVASMKEFADKLSQIAPAKG